LEARCGAETKNNPSTAARAINGKANMKKSIITVSTIGALAALALIGYARRTPARVSSESPSAAPVTQAAQEPKAPDSARPEPEPAPPLAQAPVLSTPASVSAAATNPRLEQSLLNQAVDTLVSSQTTYAQKQEAWKQLRQGGKLDQAIAELQQRMANDPRAAEYPATLGQAYLQKCGTIQDVREQGILALQADKLFDSALSLDASNWEARFTKAVALSYWPANMNKGDEVIQQFQALIQQQETVSPQPQFADSYVWLGDQYQKSGRNDDERSVWQRGASLFPNNEKLQNKLASAQ